MGNFKYDWEKDLITPPLSSESSSNEWMDVVKNQIMNQKRSIFNRFAPLVGSLSVIVLALGIFAAKNDKILGLILDLSVVQGLYAPTLTYEQVRYPPRNKVFENQEQLSKEEQKKADFIQNMAYAYQNIKTLKGKADIRYYTDIGQTSISTVEFQIREGKNPASYLLVNQPNGTKSEYINDNHYELRRSDGKEQRERVSTRNPENEPKLTFVSKADGQPSYYFPADPAWSSSAEVIVAPLRHLGWIVVDLELWSIKSRETFLGRKINIIEGKLPSSRAEKMHADTYKIWVDDETSMVLKNQTYDNKGKVVESFEVTSIEVNPQLDFSIFDTSKKKE
ncbi:hypothetical protein QFZ77_006927 [Paenibacillus sp. V4I3]|uniref:sigma-E factor regulatory protein RseB domain-containing protein n=1 Tax=Paenibacillus sp. V4I3 TaxID=3042305 RepID=UPI00277D9332|nr:sigma-E factor regulatory protein RseB domain-containing protein [Paenibacillus sp. V4I3]MDQ0878268.1 hypothetical protein [Paenibacillus sp. V4I3]